ncbi:MAG: rhodanese-like domain-containing protein [Paracoccaceae bacterium]
MRYFLTLLLSIFLNLNVAQAQDIEIEVAQLKNLLDSNAVVVDIRREEEWKQTGVIFESILSTFFNKDGTANINVFLDDLRESVSPKQTILLICRTGRRTKVATKFMLSNTEFKEVFSVSGGITEWKKQGFSTVSYP